MPLYGLGCFFIRAPFFGTFGHIFGLLFRTTPTTTTIKVTEKCTTNHMKLGLLQPQLGTGMDWPGQRTPSHLKSRLHSNIYFLILASYFSNKEINQQCSL